jgi:hypothetical protein
MLEYRVGTKPGPCGLLRRIKESIVPYKNTETQIED